jgi:hypothetical protein
MRAPLRSRPVVRLAALAAVVLGLGSGSAAARSGSEIRVPRDVPDLAGAVASARPGDTIILDAGIYPGGVVVPARTHDITIRGVDRNRVILDGADKRENGIVVHADGVSLLNMSAHNFLENAFYWDEADRFRGSYLTAWNVRAYGIYVEHGSQGRIDHSYVSGAARAAYYIGECRPCRATIDHVVGALSAVGYSGTNSTGVVIRDSVWSRNGAGIVPNTYANEALPPEARTTIVGNAITSSGRARVPIRTALAGFVGIGIAIAGGNENVVRDNRVTGSERYGIAVLPTAHHVTFDAHVKREPGPPWRARGNRISRNVVSRSGWADLALAAGSGRANCFTANTARSTAPRGLQTSTCSGASPVGDDDVAAVVAAPVRVMFDETIDRRRPPSYTSMPAPPRQPSMPSR